MTEQEQKAFDLMREALNSLCKLALSGESVLWTAEYDAARQALAAANAVSEQPKVIQVMGLNVVLDPTMKPNEMELVQPQAQGDVSTGYVKVRVDTNPSKEGFCFCSPEDPETGDFQDEAQFFGRVYAHPQAPTDLAQAAISLQDAWLHHTGAEPSESVLGQAIDRAAELLLQVGRPQAQGERGICGEIRGACGLPCEPCEGKPDPEWVTKNPQATEPAGWKLVPVEPTPAMLSSFYEAHGQWINEEGDDALIYRAMLAAAPEAKQ